MKKIPVCKMCGSRGWQSFSRSEDKKLECKTCLSEYNLSDCLKPSRNLFWWVVGGLSAIAILLYIPITRHVILFILPLGFKADDIIFFTVVTLLVVAFSRGWFIKLTEILFTRKD